MLRLALRKGGWVVDGAPRGLVGIGGTLLGAHNHAQPAGIIREEGLLSKRGKLRLRGRAHLARLVLGLCEGVRAHVDLRPVASGLGVDRLVGEEPVGDGRLHVARVLVLWHLLEVGNEALNKRHRTLLDVVGRVCLGDD